MSIGLGAAAGDVVVRFVGDTSSFDRSVDSVQGKLTGFAKSTAGLGTMMTAAFTVPITAAGGAALKMAADYQESMNVLQAVTGATDEQMKQLGETAVTLGADVTLPATSAKDATDAMLELSKAGLSVNDTMAAAKGVLQLSAAGQLSNARAAEIAANALNAFHLEGSKASEVANLLAAAANSSSLEVGDVANGFKMASAVFNAFQSPVVGAENAMIDLTTALAIMGNAGIKGSDAGTSLKQMLLQLTGPSDKAKGLMRDLAASIGVSGDIAFDASGRMRSLSEIVELTSRATKGMTDEQRSYALTTIFGADATRAIISLMDAGSAGFDQMREAVTKEGAAAEMANAHMKGLNGAFEGFKSMLETEVLRLAGPTLGFFEGIVRGATGVVEGLFQLPGPVLAAAAAFAGVLAAAGPVLLILSGLAAALAFLLSPIGLVVVALGALAAAVAGNFGGMRQIVGEVVSFISDSLGRLTTAFQTNGLAGVLDVLGQLGQEALAKVRAIDWTPVGEALLTGLGMALDLLSKGVSFGINLAGKFVDWLTGQLDQIDWSAVGATLKTGFGKAVDLLGTGMSFGVDIAAKLLGWLGDQIAKIDWSQVGGTLKSGFGTAVDLMGKGLEFGVDVAGKLLSWLGDQLGKIDWSRVGATLKSGFGTAVDLLGKGVSFGVDIAGKLLGWLGDQIGKIDWSRVGATLQSGFGKAVDLLGQGVGAAVDLGSKLASWIGGQVSQVDWSEAADRLWRGLLSLTGLTLDIGADIADYLARQLSATDFGGPAGEILSGLAESLRGVSEGLQGASQIVGLLQPVVDFLTTIFSPTIATWRDTLSGAFGQLGPLVREFGETFNSLAPIVTVVAGLILGVLLTALSLLLDVIGAALPGVIQAAVGIITTFLNSLQLIADVVTGVVTIVAKLLQGDWKGAWEAAGKLVSDVVDDVKGILTGLGNTIGGIVQAVADAIVAPFKWLYDVLVGHSIVPELVAQITSLFQGLSDALGRIWDGIKAAAQTAWGLVRDYIVSPVTELADQVGTLIADLRDTLAGLWDEIKSYATTAWDATKQYFLDTADAVISAIQTPFSTAAAFLDDLWNGAQGLVAKLSGYWDAVKGYFVEHAQEMVDAVQAPFQSAATFLGELWDGASGLVTKLGGYWTSIKSFFVEHAGEMITALETPFTTFRDGIGEVMSAAGRYLMAPLNLALQGFESFQHGVVDILNWITDNLGQGKPFGYWTAPQLSFPGAATGITNAPGGLMWVGERGKELMYVPQGASVYPHDQSLAMAKGVDFNPSALGGMGGGILGTITDVASSLWDTVSSWVSKGASWVLQQAISAVGDLELDLPGQLSLVSSSAISMVKDWLVGWIDKLLDEVGGIVDAAKSALGSILPGGGGDAGGGWVRPLAGYSVTQEYGPSSAGLGYDFHTGIDLAAARGSTIYAARGGMVTQALASGYNSGYGNVTQIDHGGGLGTLYGHQLSLMVGAGQQVSAGQPIGLVDSTGNSTGDHLHFEIRENGATVDPRKYIAFGNGGLIVEPIVGYGMRTGNGYLFGERGLPEEVGPVGAGRGGGDIVVNFNGPTTIAAGSRAEAEQAAGNVGWGVRAALARRGVA